MGIPATNQDVDNINQRIERNVEQLAQHNRNILRLSTSLGRISGIVENSFRTADEKHCNSSQKIIELETKIDELSKNSKCSFVLHAIEIAAYIIIVISIIVLFHKMNIIQLQYMKA